MKKVVILGCGGHCRVLLDSIRRMGDENLKIECFLDANKDIWGEKVEDAEVKGGDELLPEIKKSGIDYFIVGLGGIGNCYPRANLFNIGLSFGLKPLTIVDPTAIISKNVQICQGAQILAGAIVNTGAIIGENSIVNSGAIVEHDCKVGNNVHIAPGVSLSGNVEIGDLSHIGTGATIIQGIKIGKNSIVGAGSTVIKNVLDNTIVAGVPAKVIKRGKNL